MKAKATEEIRNYITQIDAHYKEAKATRVSRFDLAWGKWSAEMNKETKAKVDAGDHPQEIPLSYVYIYWVNRSQLLELHYQSKFLRMAHKTRLLREGRKIKRMTLSGEAFDKSLLDRPGVILSPIGSEKAP